MLVHSITHYWLLWSRQLLILTQTDLSPYIHQLTDVRSSWIDSAQIYRYVGHAVSTTQSVAIYRNECLIVFISCQVFDLSFGFGGDR